MFWGKRLKFDFGEECGVLRGVLFAAQISALPRRRGGIEEAAIGTHANNFELYFEEEDFSGFLEKIGQREDIIFIQPCVLHAWGKRVVRFCGPDFSYYRSGGNA